jgi:hypothetical protein
MKPSVCVVFTRSEFTAEATTASDGTCMELLLLRIGFWMSFCSFILSGGQSTDDYSMSMLKLLSTAYSTVSVVDASGFLGLSENETVTCKNSCHVLSHPSICARFQWIHWKCLVFVCGICLKWPNIAFVLPFEDINMDALSLPFQMYILPHQ